MTTWIWSRADHKGLARFVNQDAAWEAAALDLGIDRLAEEAKEDGRRTIVEVIYNNLCCRQPRITYDREEFLRYADYRQKIRTPRTILDTDNRGTCLDLALLFCALCLKSYLLPFVIIVEGHALAAVLLTHGRNSQGTDAWDSFSRPDFDAVRDSEGEIVSRDAVLGWIDNGTLLPIECTGFAYSEALPDTCPEGRGRDAGFLDFCRSVAAAREQIETARRPFYAIDIQFLQDELGFEADAPPDAPLVTVQAVGRKPVIPPEYLGWLVALMLNRGEFRDKTGRDRLAADVHQYWNMDVRLRSEEPRNDLYYILAAVFQHVDGQTCFETLLSGYVAETTCLGHLTDYARDLASLADLRPLLSHVDLNLRDLRSCYIASLRDPQRAREIDSVEEALHDLLDLLPSRRNGWRPICELIERVARLCHSDPLHRWVEEQEADPVRRTELYAALDCEQALAPPTEYIVVDVPSPEPDALEFWRRFDCNNVPQVHDFQPCPATATPLMDAVALLADRAADWSTNVRLEIFLPMAMLASDVDQWPCETIEGIHPLGERHVVAIRWRERARHGKRQPQWQAFAARLKQKTPARPVLGWLEHGPCGGLKFAEEITRGKSGDCLAFPFIPFEPTNMRKLHGHLQSALGGGMVYGLWLRREPVNWQAFRAHLATLFDAGGLGEFPGRIKDARCEVAEHHDPEHPFRNLSLFWDEPHRNPWQQGEATQPGQRT